MVKDGIYNHRVYLPEELKPSGQIIPRYTHHAHQQAKEDRYGEVPVLSVIDFSEIRIDEVEVRDSKVVKVVCRKKIDNWRDMTVVIVPFTRKVVTTWSNMYHDHHDTVDLSKYVKP